MPRMTAAQKNAITSPSEGLLIWQTDEPAGFQYYANGSWNYFGGDDLGSHEAIRNLELNNHWISNDGADNGIWVDGSGNVGVGTDAPIDLLHVDGGNIRIGSQSGNANALVFENPSGSHTSTISAGPQTADMDYILPIAAPTDGQVMTSNATGEMEWQSIHTLLGTATRAVNGNGTSQDVNNNVFVNMNQMSMSVQPGNYIVLFNAEITMSSGNTVGEFIVRVNGNDVAESSRRIKAPGNNDPGNVSIISLVNVTTAGNLTIRFRRSSGSGTMTVTGRTLMLVRVG